MILRVNNQDCLEIENSVFKMILNFYPEEKLIEHKPFKEAIEANKITILELKKLSSRIHTPWQIFFLSEKELKKELSEIEKKRIDKFPKGRVDLDKRKGLSNLTSKRVVDRLIRVQNFVSGQIPDNQKCQFIGSLNSKSIENASLYISDYFNINIKRFRSQKKPLDALNYLIESIEMKGDINISKGVLKNGILSTIDPIKKVYKNTSGFVIKNEKIPFIFLPYEINPEENHYRQILTLVYLIVVIGLDKYEFWCEESLSFNKTISDKDYNKIYGIVSEFLFPKTETDLFIKDKNISVALVNEFKERYKVSYSAILKILKIRTIIGTELFKSLELPKKDFEYSEGILDFIFGNQKLSKSAKNFSGSVSFDIINKNIKSKMITPTQAQLLIFGRIEKTKYKNYLSEI